MDANRIARLCRRLALAGALAATSALGITVSGRVFVDRNGDGVADVSEPGIARVAVSDGKNVVLTAENGDYRIDVEAGA